MTLSFVDRLTWTIWSLTITMQQEVDVARVWRYRNLFITIIITIWALTVQLSDPLDIIRFFKL